MRRSGLRIMTAVLAGTLLTSAHRTARAADGDSVKVNLTGPLLICHEQAGGVRAPDAKGAEAEHDLVLFILAGRDPEGKVLHTALPRDGSHRKLDTKRATKFIKDAHLREGTLNPGRKNTAQQVA